MGRKSSQSGKDHILGLELGGGAIRWERPSEVMFREKERVRDAVIMRQYSVIRSSKSVVVIGYPNLLVDETSVEDLLGVGKKKKKKKKNVLIHPKP